MPTLLIWNGFKGTRFIRYFEMFYSKQREKLRGCLHVNTVDLEWIQGQSYEVHPVFEMFYSKQREKLVYVDTVDTCCIE